LEADKHSAGFPLRVMTISCFSASRRKRERSSLSSHSGIRDLRIEPQISLRFGDDRQDFDGRAGNIVEPGNLAHAERVLRPNDAS